MFKLLNHRNHLFILRTSSWSIVSSRKREIGRIIASDELPLSTLVGWQRERIQHLQRLSQSILNGLFAFFAIIISVTALGERTLPAYPLSTDVITSIAKNEIIGETGVSITVLLGSLLIGIFAILATSLALKSLQSLYEVVTTEHIEPRVDRDYVSIEKFTGSSSVPEGGTGARSLIQIYYENKDIVKQTQNEFRKGAVRAGAVVILTCIVGIYLYYILSREMQGVLFMSAVYSLPEGFSAIFPRIFGFSNTPGDRPKVGTSVAEKFLTELAIENLTSMERILLRSIFPISGLIVLTWTLDVAWTFI